MMKIRQFLAVAAMAGIAVPAMAQSPSCVLPASIPQAHEQTASEPANKSRTDYLALALSWSPQFCAEKGGAHAQDFQCKLNRFSFVVHGLWPQSANAKGAAGHPRWCGGGTVDAETARKTLCTVPGVSLMQGEWQKHGSCYFESPATYFTKVRDINDKLVKPDARRLSAMLGEKLTAGDLVAAFVDANRTAGLKPSSVAVQVTKRAALREVLVCYDLSYRFTDCRTGRAPDSLRIRIAE